MTNLDDRRLAAIRDCCVRLLALRALLRIAESRLAAEIGRARLEYGFTPFAEGGEDAGIKNDQADSEGAGDART